MKKDDRIFVIIKGDERPFILTDSLHSYDKIIKVRKEQKCRCNNIIKKGDEALVSQRQIPYREYYREYYCKGCFKFLDKTPIDTLPEEIKHLTVFSKENELKVSMANDHFYILKVEMDKRYKLLAENGFVCINQHLDEWIKTIEKVKK